MSPLGPGQLALYNLLKAYSLLDEEVGYCQGLSFIAGILLLHVSHVIMIYIEIIEYPLLNTAMILDERRRSLLHAAASYVQAEFEASVFTRHGWLTNTVVSADEIIEGPSAATVRTF